MIDWYNDIHIILRNITRAFLVPYKRSRRKKTGRGRSQLNEHNFEGDIGGYPEKKSWNTAVPLEWIKQNTIPKRQNYRNTARKTPQYRNTKNPNVPLNFVNTAKNEDYYSQ